MQYQKIYLKIVITFLSKKISISRTFFMQFYATKTWDKLSVNIDHLQCAMCMYIVFNVRVGMFVCKYVDIKKCMTKLLSFRTDNFIQLLFVMENLEGEQSRRKDGQCQRIMIQSSIPKFEGWFLSFKFDPPIFLDLMQNKKKMLENHSKALYLFLTKSFL